LLSSISVTIVPDAHSGVININSVGQTQDVSNIGKIVIARKVTSGTDWNDISTVTVEDVGDLTFEMNDISAVAGQVYSYNFDVYPPDSEMPSESGMVENIKCTLDGLFIGDSAAQYVAIANFQTEHMRNTAVQHVTTLSGRYPYRISNADTNYETGTSSGLFMYFDPDTCTITPDNYHVLSKEIIDWLTNGESKVLKTHDGQVWLVSIGENPAEIYNEFLGAHTIEFDWTEIGDVSEVELVGVSA